MRKSTIITIEKEGRDKGKKFRITEMPVIKAEKWATRAFMALANIGLDLPENGVGISGLATAFSKYGLQSLAKIPYDKVSPLYDELLDCCEYLGDGTSNVSRQMDNKTAEEVVEEVSTLFTLRFEAIKIHLDFLGQGEK